MIVVATQKRSRMLVRFGQIVGMDATYKTVMWGLPFFILCVVNAQGQAYPAAYFWLSSETKEGIAEVLVCLKSMVPEWAPQIFMVDKSSAEIGAIEMVFPPPDTHTSLCDFHVKQSWHRTVNSSEYNVGKKEERVCISVSECIRCWQLLRTAPIWMQRMRLLKSLRGT